jgi:hypothetical protein
MSIQRTISARPGQELDYAKLREIVPSLFADRPHASRSAKYEFIPTIDIARDLWREGWAPVMATESRTRDLTRRGFTQHMVRFRRRDAIMDATSRFVGQVHGELVLRGSHDGTTLHEFFSGLFRLACLNGLVVSDGGGSSFKIKHLGDTRAYAIEQSLQVAKRFEHILPRVQAFQGIMLNREERMALAEGAHNVRFGTVGASEAQAHAIKPAQLLAPRRFGDQASDLWTTYNVIQENAIRGGLTGVNHGQDMHGRPTSRRSTTKSVQGVSQNIALNQALWALTERMAELKAA